MFMGLGLGLTWNTVSCLILRPPRALVHRCSPKAGCPRHWERPRVRSGFFATSPSYPSSSHFNGVL